MICALAMAVMQLQQVKSLRLFTAEMVDYVVVFQEGVEIPESSGFLAISCYAKNRPSPGQEAPAKVVIDRDQKDFHGILPGTIAD